MNPDTNRFEELHLDKDARERREQLGKKIDQMAGRLLRPDGSPVPETWTTFQIGELVVIKDYTFKVAYIGESNILFEPSGPLTVRGIEEDDPHDG